MNKEEIDTIHTISTTFANSISPNYWGYLPYYDEVLNTYNINDELLNKIKSLSQQNISKTMMDLLIKFITMPDIFQHTINLGGQFKNFGTRSSSYINTINSSLTIDINISPNNIVIQNKLYYSLINIDNEFGLAVISTCVYTELSNNKVFLIWKIDRWRNI